MKDRRKQIIWKRQKEIHNIIESIEKQRCYLDQKIRQSCLLWQLRRTYSQLPFIAQRLIRMGKAREKGRVSRASVIYDGALSLFQWFI